MSALGHKQTFAVQIGMSALPPKADIVPTIADVRFVNSRHRVLLDHPFGASVQREWCRQTEGLDGESYRLTFVNMKAASTDVGGYP